MAIVIPTATFLHIPKCGGTWVARAMAAAGLPMQVIPSGRAHRIAATEGRFVFTFVRHPLTWYASFWKYRWNSAARLGEPITERLREDARRGDELIDECLVDETGEPRSFVGFLEQCLARHPGFLSRKYSRFTAEAHYIGRQESLCEDLLTALGRAGALFDAEAIRRIPLVNVSSSRFVATYPHALAERLVAAERATVEKFYSGNSIRRAALAA